MEHTVDLAGEYLLLVLDDHKGGFRQDLTTIDYTVAAAELVDLVGMGALEFTGTGENRTFVPGEKAPQDPLLAELAELAAGRSYDEAITALSGGVSGGDDKPRSLRSLELERLVNAGILRAQHGKLLGLIPRTRYPQADPTVELELRARLSGALVGTTDLDDRSRALIALLYAAHALGKAFPDLDQKRIWRRGKEIANESWEDDGLALALAQYATYMATLSAASLGR